MPAFTTLLSCLTLLSAPAARLRRCFSLNEPALGRLIGCLVLSAAGGLNVAQADTSKVESYLQRAEVQSYIAETASKTDLDQAWLEELFGAIGRQDRVIERISSPAEVVLNWGQYRQLFLKPKRIAEGRQFLKENAEILAKAEREFGVPPEIITAIIGVETFYGRLKGKDPALASLATLAFDYPPRSKFFRSELTEFLLLSKEEGLDPLEITGSYAAAMGVPQFISSSYRRYAIDFDGDGKRDLWQSTEDVIGSVANYFAEHGWQPQGPVVEQVFPKDMAYRSLLRKSLKPSLKAAQLAEKNIRPRTVSKRKKSLLELETANGKQVWVGFHNFYVITRYNHSSLYAMAVYELSQEINKSEG